LERNEFTEPESLGPFDQNVAETLGMPSRVFESSFVKGAVRVEDGDIAIGAELSATLLTPRRHQHADVHDG
jgi:hypothetical protein